MSKCTWKLHIVFAGNPVVRDHWTRDIRVHAPDWADTPLLPIERVELSLPIGHKLVLANMQSFNFFIEAIQGFGARAPKMQAAYLLGQLPKSEHVEVWRIGHGIIHRKRYLKGNEWCGTSTRGWKVGQPAGNMFAGLIKE